MEHLFEILKILLPSVVVFVTVYYVLKLFLANEQTKLSAINAGKNREVALPLKLQAYERLALFLERIAFENLIPRTPAKNFTAYEYQNVLIQTVRQEFEHNLSQQLYVSSETWETIKNAKEEVISIINSSASKVQNDSSAIELSSLIFENSLKFDKPVRVKALEMLKKEARLLM